MDSAGVVRGSGSEQAASGSSLHRIDNRRTPCALGLLHVQRVMAEVPIGDVVEVTTRDRYAVHEVPAWVDRHDLELVSQRRSGWWLFSTSTFTIRKTAAVAAPRA